jgi:hypothetical protein
MARSLSYLNFKINLEQEIRNYWHIRCSLIYTERKWQDLGEENWPSRITQQNGDDRSPFKNIDLSPKDFLDNNKFVIEHSRENAIVNFVTAFEVYLSDLTSRLIFLKPSLIKESEIDLDAHHLVKAVESNSTKLWLANYVSDKYLRNNSPKKLISKVAKLAKCGVEKEKEEDVKFWVNVTLLRNAIVHNGRRVTPELSNSWQEEFPTPGRKLNINDRIIVKTHGTALTIAKSIDDRAITTTIKRDDSEALVRDYFIRTGIDEHTTISKFALNTIDVRLERNFIQQSISKQKKNPSEELGVQIPTIIYE